MHMQRSALLVSAVCGKKQCNYDVLFTMLMIVLILLTIKYFKLYPLCCCNLFQCYYTILQYTQVYFKIFTSTKINSLTY